MRHIPLTSLFRPWGIRAWLLLSGALLLGASAALGQPPSVGADTPATPISSRQLLNLSYPNQFARDGSVTLDKGAYSEPTAPDSAAAVSIEYQRGAFGVVAGRDAAAIVLATNAGGSGRFYDLHLVRRTANGALQTVASRFLGDRIRLQGLTFQGEDIRVDFTGFAVADPLCCPSRNVARVYRMQENKGKLVLVRVEESPARLALAQGLSLFSWFGAPTSSSAILNGSASLDTIWHYRRDDGSWIADSRWFPRSLRQTILVERGSSFFVSAHTATEIPVPIMPPPPACPLTPGPPDPIDPSMFVRLPGNGEQIRGSVPVAGVARVFEATVGLRVLTADGTLLADSFATAAVGGPWFGSFASEIAVSVTEPTEACVQVFESSAIDGRPVNTVQIGVILLPDVERS